MGLPLGVASFIQGLVYAALATYLWPRWAPSGVLMATAALLQGAAGVTLVRATHPGLPRKAAFFSLGAVALVLGLHVQVALFILDTFTPVGARFAWGLLGAVAMALPYLVIVPTLQLFCCRGRGTGAGTAALLFLFLLPPAQGLWQKSGGQDYRADKGAEAAQWLFAQWSETPSTEAPQSPGPVSIFVTTYAHGRELESQHLEAEDLATALEKVEFLRPFGARAGLLLEMVTRERALPRGPFLPEVGLLLRPGEEGLRLEDSALSARAIWQGRSIQSRPVGTGAWAPLVTQSNAESRLLMRGWLASTQGTTELNRGWSRADRLSVDSLMEAVTEAAYHLARNMSDVGRFAYVVQSPSGQHGPGYNFPRHAGGAWFLSRVARLTQDPILLQAASRACDFLAQHSTRLEDSAYVIDPKRRDGKAWGGTTALALLAFLENDLHPDLQAGYAHHLASSVDDRGRVLGDFDVGSQTWPEQDEVTYAQGQVLLALAAAEGANLPGVEHALSRTIEHVEESYWPQPASRMAILDEHWICLAAEETRKVRSVAAGEAVCRAWLVDRYPFDIDAPLAPAAGAAGATAEAFVAAAWMDRASGVDGQALEQARAYGQLFLDQRYQASDAPLLVQPRALVGGFRDKPWKLDVRVDAVQHIGFALLGLAELLQGLEAAPPTPT